jgi:FMN reductase
VTYQRRLVVVSAGLSQPSSTRLLADRLSTATAKALVEHGETVDVRTVELRDHAHAVVNNLLTGFPDAELASAIEAVVSADGLVVVTPVFNASYSGLFKSFFDCVDSDALTGKPVLAAATGGTARHSLALEHAVRPLFTYLHAVVTPTSVYAASQDWGSDQGEGAALAARIDRAARELATLMHARAFEAPPDPFDAPTPFEDLLAGNPGVRNDL